MAKNDDGDRVDNMRATRRTAIVRGIPERGSDVWIDTDEDADDDLGLDVEVFDASIHEAELDRVDIPRKDQRLADRGYDLKTQLTRHDAAKRAIERTVARKFPGNPLGKHFDPLLFLSLVAASPRVNMELRVNAAKTVIQYTQPKPPQELHTKIEDETPLVDKEAIQAKLDLILRRADDDEGSAD